MTTSLTHTNTKTCSKCGETKPLAEFNRRTGAKDGLHSNCKACTRKRDTEYRERLRRKNIGGSSEVVREQRCYMCDTVRPATDFRPDPYRKSGLRSRCRDCDRTFNCKYNAARSLDPEYRAYRRTIERRRDRTLAKAKSTPYDRVSIFERDGWVCQLCGEPVDREACWPDPGCATIDHIVPLSLGGEDSPSNVRLAHYGCNSSRQDKPWRDGAYRVGAAPGSFRAEAVCDA